MATIKDVAKEANVSTATVSRVVNGNYPVNDETRKKVNEAIRKLKYTPNAVARGLKVKATFLVGMVVPDISNPFFMEIAKGIESEISQYGYNIVFCSSDEIEEKEIKMLSMLHNKQVDAVILATRAKSNKRINEFIDQGMTIVMVDSKVNNVKADNILENGYEATRDAIEYAISKGHRKIGIINGIMSVSTSLDRYNAYKDVLENNNIKLNQKYIVNGEFNREVAYESTKKMLQDTKDNLPTLLFSTNNIMSEGALIAIKEEGLKIPDDISLISFGNLSVPRLVQPKLTVIEQSSYQMGKKAGELLLLRLNNELDNNVYREIVIKLSLREGESVSTIN